MSSRVIGVLMSTSRSGAPISPGFKIRGGPRHHILSSRMIRVLIVMSGGARLHARSSKLISVMISGSGALLV